MTSVCKDVLVENKLGLHMRSATKLANLANSFKAAITVNHEEKSVAANSVMGLLMLASQQGKTVTICCEGDDAQQALDAVCELFANKFDEDE